MVQSIKYFVGLPAFLPESYFFRALQTGSVVTATTTDLSYADPESGAAMVFHGSFQLSAGVVTGGTVTGFDLVGGATTIEQGTGMAISATSLLSAISDYQTFLRDPLYELLYSNAIQTGSSDDDVAMFAWSGTVRGLGGDDVIFGGDGVFTFIGGKGDDQLYGGSGYATLYGGEGNDAARIGDHTGVAKGGVGDDRLSGGDEGASTLYGNKGNDLLAENGATVLMYGGKGSDFFSLQNLGAPDVIGDFNPKHDTIGIWYNTFADIDLGVLQDSAFGIGTQATTPDQRIIYDNATGALLYDRDGSLGGYAPVHFATLSNLPKVQADDFLVFFHTGGT